MQLTHNLKSLRWFSWTPSPRVFLIAEGARGMRQPRGGHHEDLRVAAACRRPARDAIRRAACRVGAVLDCHRARGARTAALGGIRVASRHGRGRAYLGALWRDVVLER